MSDMIKDRYKKEMEHITPSAEFLSGLSETLKQEQNGLRRRKINYMKIVITAAACITAVLCGTLSFVNHLNNVPVSANTDSMLSQHKSDVDHKFDNIDTDTITSRHVNPSSLFDDDMTAEQCAKIFIDKADKGELSYIKVSDSNVFTSARDNNNSQRERLLDLLRSGKNADSVPDGEKVYYMAVFSDGKIVKLIVTDNKYVEFSGTGKYLSAE